MNKRRKDARLLQLDFIEKADRFSAQLFVALLCFFPLIVRATTIDFVSPGIYSPMLDTGLHGDFFTNYKWIILTAAAVVLNAVLLLKIWIGKYEIISSYVNIPLLLLVILVQLSAMTADYHTIALIGLYNQHEGTLTYLAYLTLFFICANTIFKPSFARWAASALIIVTFVNMLIALVSLSGHDIAEIQFVKNLLVPENLQSSIHGSIRSMLAHPNYSSGLSAALFAFFFTRALLDDDLKERLIYSAAALASFVAVLASISSSGFVTLLLLTPFLVAVCWLNPRPLQAIKVGGIILFICAGILGIMNAFNPAVGAESVGFVRSLWHSDSQLPPLDSSQFGVDAEQATYELSTNSGEDRPLKVMEEVDSRSDLFALPEPGWAPGTGRLYIWEETVKLIKARPFCGYGLDTLAYYFPQNDINMISNMWEYGVLVTKPHNFYLAIAYGAGIPALLVLLSLFMLHFYHSGRYLLTSPRDKNLALPAAVFLFFCAFAVQWLFNDAVLGSAAIFWIITGIGVSFNRTL